MKGTLKALLGQLAADGKLLDRRYRPLSASGEDGVTGQRWLNGRNMRVFRIAQETLFGADEVPEARPGPRPV